MNFNLKNKKAIFSILACVMMLTGILISSLAFAVDKVRVVYFYTDWNARCRRAEPVIQTVINSYQGRVDYVRLNMDQPSTPDRATQLGITVPRSIPYIIVLDKNGNVATEFPYTSQTPEQLKAIIDPIVAR